MEALAGHWRANLGIEVEWEVVPWAEFSERLGRELPHVCPLVWGADYPDPDNFLRVALKRQTNHWGNPTYDGLVERARRLTDQDERMKLYRQADRMLMEEAVVMPLAYWREHKLVKPSVSRFPTSPAREHFWKDVVIEPH
ncbi:MAG: hypothetical protein PVH41_19095 [Anaerolineae bacterium]|jgi:oligopeptide transport system substrate-binding protein